MKSFGEGARAVIWFNCKNKPNIGHAIIAQCRENGIVVLGDPQKKSRAAARKIQQADFNKIALMRVDNLNFKDLIKRCCMNRGSENDNT